MAISAFEDMVTFNAVREWLALEMVDIIPLGPSTTLGGQYLHRVCNGVEDKIEAHVLAIMTDGSFIKPEGMAMAKFKPPALAWHMWRQAFERHILEIRKTIPDPELIWSASWPLEFGGCECGGESCVHGRAWIYDKRGIEWEFRDDILVPSEDLKA